MKKSIEQHEEEQMHLSKAFIPTILFAIWYFGGLIVFSIITHDYQKIIEDAHVLIILFMAMWGIGLVIIGMNGLNE